MFVDAMHGFVHCPHFHTAYMSCPCHVELVVSEREQTVKAEDDERTERRLTKVQAARQRRKVVKA